MGTNGFDTVHFDPAGALEAASRLDGLADRLSDSVTRNQEVLAPAAAGADEVSVRAAQTLAAVADSFTGNAQDGVGEVRRLAAVLRLQAGRYDQAEQDNSAAITATIA